MSKGVKLLFVFATILVAVMPSAFALGFDAVKSNLESCTTQAAGVGISCPAGTYFCGSDGCRSRDYLYNKFDLEHKDGANWQATCYPKEVACGISCAPGSVACGSECKIPQENPACTEQGLSTDPCNSNNCGGPLAAPAIKHSEAASYPSDEPAINIVQKGTGALLSILNKLGVGITVSNEGNLEVAGDVKGKRVCIGDVCNADWPITGITGTGTTDYLTKWNANGKGLIDSIIIETDTGFVGIGIANPTEALDVQGNIKATGNLDVVNINAGGDIVADGDISANRITVNNGIDAAGIVTFPNLADCNTIDTGANGNLVCGTDEGVTGAGTSDAIPKFDATGKGLADSIIIETDDGFIGIGINPTERLHISGNIKATGNLDVANINAGGDIVAGGDIGGNRITAANGIEAAGLVKLSGLADCNTIDTDANGNLVCGDDEQGVTVEADPTVLDSVKDGVDWAELTGVPADIVTGTGIDDNLAKWTADGGLADSIITDNDNSISIAGNVFSSGYLSLAGLRFGGAFSNSPNVGNQGAVVMGAGEQTESINIEPGTNNFDVGNIILASTINGKVGIGTATPTAKLDVGGDIKATGTVQGNKVSSTTYSSKAPTVLAGDGQYGLSSDGAKLYLWSIDNGFGFRNSNSPNTDLVIITSTGTVGIGTTTPAEKLEVAGNIKASGKITGTQLCMGTNCLTPDNTIIAQSRTANKISKWTLDKTLGDSIITDTGSSVGIGTTNVEQVLHVSGANEILSTGTGAGFKFRDRKSTAIKTTDDWAWYAKDNVANLWYGGASTGSNNNFISVTKAGNVGIGLASGTTPAEKLEVAGNIKLAGEIIFPDDSKMASAAVASGGGWSEGSVTTNTQKKVTIGEGAPARSEGWLNIVYDNSEGLRIQKLQNGLSPMHIIDSSGNIILKVHESGNVGIGTDPDQAKLDVYGGIATRGPVGEIAIFDRTSIPQGTWKIYSDASGYLKTYRDGAGDKGIIIPPEGGVILNTKGQTRPNCAANKEGLLWYQTGSPSRLYLCYKDSSGTLVWKIIV